MGYKLPPNLEKLDKALRTNSGIKDIAAKLSPEEIQAVRSRVEKIRDTMHRLSTPNCYHPPVAQQRVQEPETVAAY